MSIVIQDGRTGQTAEVDSDNRLKTAATSQTASTSAAFNGDLFNVNTGTLNLTTANPSALLYLSNIDIADWVMTRVFYNAEVSTGGSGGWLAEVIANPSAGTLVSAGTAFLPANLNFGSAKLLTSTTLKGVEGSTITDGEVRVSTIVPASGVRVLISFDSIILEPGASIAVRITPPAGNTSLDIQVGFNLYRVT